VEDERAAKESNLARFAAFHAAMLRQGVLLPPSQFECWFLSLAHDDDTIDAVVRAASTSFAEIA
jgi:glutamate-1-semialdehyde 2,1-aminomutase